MFYYFVVSILCYSKYIFGKVHHPILKKNQQSNILIVDNLENSTRKELSVPCLESGLWAKI